MLDSSLYSIPARLIIGSPLPVTLKEPHTSALEVQDLYGQLNILLTVHSCFFDLTMLRYIKKCDVSLIWWRNVKTAQSDSTVGDALLGLLFLNADKIILKMGKHIHTTTVTPVVLEQGSRVGTQVELKFEKTQEAHRQCVLHIVTIIDKRIPV